MGQACSGQERVKNVEKRGSVAAPNRQRVRKEVGFFERLKTSHVQYAEEGHDL